jgi:hypothetical protein
MHLHPQRGQVGIILLLIVVVISTLGISVVSRTTTDVNLSKSAEEANKALDAAESGVEQALSNPEVFQDSNLFTGSLTPAENINVDYTVDKLRILDAVVDEGYSAGVDVTGAPVGGTLKIQWARETACSANPASLVVTIYSASTSPPFRRFFEGACTHTPDDGFTLVSTAGSGGYFRTVSIALQTTDTLVRIRPVYNDTALQVSGGGWNLPVQLYKVKSTAQNSINKETKAVEVDRGLKMPPSIFDYTLFSGNRITQ